MLSRPWSADSAPVSVLLVTMDWSRIGVAHHSKSRAESSRGRQRGMEYRAYACQRERERNGTYGASW